MDRIRIQEAQKHLDPVDPVRIRIRIRNTDFYIDLSRYGGHEVQQKQVNCLCKVQKQEILTILLQNQEICYTRARFW